MLQLISDQAGRATTFTILPGCCFCCRDNVSTSLFIYTTTTTYCYLSTIILPQLLYRNACFDKTATILCHNLQFGAIIIILILPRSFVGAVAGLLFPCFSSSSRGLPLLEMHDDGGQITTVGMMSDSTVSGHCAYSKATLCLILQ